MRLLLNAYYKLLLVALGCLTAFIMVPVGLQILPRFTDVIPYYMWTEEVSRFCLIWMIMLGSTVAVRENTHFDIDLLPPAKTSLGALIGKLVVRGFILLFGIVFLVGSVEFAEFGSIMSSEITDINLVWVYGVFPFAAAGWVIFTLEAIWDAVAEYRRAISGQLTFAEG
jgi:TRAP-type C4-dicarboxylate transport system permease small subunit